MKENKSIESIISKYRLYLSKEYKSSTINYYCRIIKKFIEWEKGFDSRNTTFTLVQIIEEYLRVEFPVHHRNQGFKTVRAALHSYHYFFTNGTNFLKTEVLSEETLDVEKKVDEYHTYLNDVIGCANATKTIRLRYVKCLLSYVKFNINLDGISLNVEIVQAFLTVELKNLKPSSIKTVISCIRCYIRFLVFKGESVDRGLLLLPLASPVWNQSNIPKTLNAKEIEILLSSCNRDDFKGIRDYAIAMCFIELGLRTTEVANLELSHFNWYEGTVLIKNTKSHKERILPVSQELGDSIIKYLKTSRPKTSEPIIFVRFYHNRGEPMYSDLIRKTLIRAFNKSGSSICFTGPHMFRHTKASNLYDSGVNIKAIADILGHGTINTTAIYAKTAKSQLFSVVACWPEVKNDL